MARGNGAATADGQATTEGQQGEQQNGSGNSRANRSYIVVPLPADLKERFENEAKTADKPVGPYVRDMLAQFLGIEIPATVSTRRSKYANDEERKAAQAERTKSRSQTMRNLMAQFREFQAKGIPADEAARLAAAQQASATAQTPAGNPEDVAKNEPAAATA